MPALFDRSLSLSGASNFRDLGGYQGEGGRHVRWRKLFRSDHLAALTPDDLAAFGALGVTRAFDLRGAAERAAVSYDLPGVTQYPLPIEPTVVQRLKDLLEAGEQVTPEISVELMRPTTPWWKSSSCYRTAPLVWMPCLPPSTTACASMLRSR